MVPKEMPHNDHLFNEKTQKHVFLVYNMVNAQSLVKTEKFSQNVGQVMVWHGWNEIKQSYYFGVLGVFWALVL